jgi:hypothetical protein
VKAKVHSNIYLYNTEEVPEIPAHVIMRRLELLDDHLGELLEVSYMQRDLKKIRDVENAIKFWEEMGNV